MTRPPMPERPHEHVLETLSRRKFEIELDAWVARHTSSDDYGVDLMVEIFRDGFATGDTFAVQLKAKSDAGQSPSTTVKRSTFNYWRSLAVPALVVVWDEKDDALWYRWAHDLPFESDTSSVTRTFKVERRWNKNTLEELGLEVAAFRAAQRLALHLPIDVLVEGDEFFDKSAGDVKLAIQQSFRGMSEFKVRFAAAGATRITVTIVNKALRLLLPGVPVAEVRYGKADARPEVSSVAGDLLARLAFLLGDYGQLTDAAVTLLARAAGYSEALLDHRLADAVALLTRAGREPAVETIFRRACARSSDAQSDALIGYFAGSPEATTAAHANRVKSILVKAARSGPSGGQDFYNAANVIRSIDPLGALALYDRAAAADPTYVDRGYFWRERGELSRSAGREGLAETSYLRALAIDATDHRARQSYAEMLAQAGRYEGALSYLSDVSDDEMSEAPARVLRRALSHIVDEWGITQQVRQGSLMQPEQGETDEVSLKNAATCIHDDALNGWAHWARVPALRGSEVDVLPVLAAAAVGVRDLPQIWDELARGAYVDGDERLVFDALWCAREYCEDDFYAMLHTDTFLDQGNRETLLLLFELLPDRVRDFEVRLIRDGSAVPLLDFEEIG